MTEEMLKHEVWFDKQEDGQILPTICLLGPGGDGARALLSKNAELVTIIEARTPFSAMTKYNQFLGREAYTTIHEADFESYPDEWFEEQQR